MDRRGFLVASAAAIASVNCGQFANTKDVVTVVRDGDTVTVHNPTSRAVGFRATAIWINGRWVLSWRGDTWVLSSDDLECTGAWDVA